MESRPLLPSQPPEWPLYDPRRTFGSTFMATINGSSLELEELRMPFYFHQTLDEGDLHNLQGKLDKIDIESGDLVV